MNINPAFGTFLPKTADELIRPLFHDLISLSVLPYAPGGSPPREGRFRRIRTAGIDDGEMAVPAALQEHLTYMTFKRSRRKRYERKVGADRPFHLA